MHHFCESFNWQEFGGLDIIRLQGQERCFCLLTIGCFLTLLIDTRLGTYKHSQIWHLATLNAIPLLIMLSIVFWWLGSYILILHVCAKIRIFSFVVFWTLLCSQFLKKFFWMANKFSLCRTYVYTSRRRGF